MKVSSSNGSSDWFARLASFLVDDGDDGEVRANRTVYGFLYETLRCAVYDLTRVT